MSFLTLILFALSAPALAFNPPSIDAATIEKLVGGGQVILVEEDSAGRVKLVTGGTLVQAPPDKVWSLITDFGGYPSWMPQTVAVTAKDAGAGIKDVTFNLNFTFSVISKKVSYTTRNTLSPPHKITWKLVEGDFARTDGAWNLVPAKGGSATLVFYSTYTDLASMGWIVKSLIEEQPTMEVAIQASTALMVVKSVKETLE
jgi:ribosome-associated toxin RatA of RatAB toxin-antitoxin module